MRLLTGELKDFIYSRPWPGGERLVLDVVQEDYVGELYHPHLNFILYRDNFIQFTPDEQRQISVILQQIHEKIRKSGVPTTLEVKANVPRD